MDTNLAEYNLLNYEPCQSFVTYNSVLEVLTYRVLNFGRKSSKYVVADIFPKKKTLDFGT